MEFTANVFPEAVECSDGGTYRRRGEAEVEPEAEESFYSCGEGGDGEEIVTRKIARLGSKGSKKRRLPPRSFAPEASSAQSGHHAEVQ